jgi:hypothetical protein
MFSAEKVAEIRKRYGTGNISFRKLATEYGATTPTIGRVVRGEGGYAALAETGATG